MYSKFVIKTLHQYKSRSSGVFIMYFQHIQNTDLLETLNRFFRGKK